MHVLSLNKSQITNHEKHLKEKNINDIKHKTIQFSIPVPNGENRKNKYLENGRSFSPCLNINPWVFEFTRLISIQFYFVTLLLITKISVLLSKFSIKPKQPQNRKFFLLINLSV